MLVAFCLCALAAHGVHAAGQSKVLRVLKLRHHEAGHPHRDVAGEYSILSAFAAREGRHLRWIDGVQPAQLATALALGEGDIVIADLAPEDVERGQLLPGLAVGGYRDAVYGRVELAVHDPLQLAGLRVAISIASPLWPYLIRLGETLEGLTVVSLPDSMGREEALRGVSRGDYDAVVVSLRGDEDPVNAMPRVRSLFEFGARKASRWHYPSDKSALRDAIDAYLLQTHTAVPRSHAALGDLDVIRNRHVLRVITRVDPRNFFVRDGRQAGFEFELVRSFASDLGLSVEFLVADTDEQVLDWLRSGFGDIVTTRVDGSEVAADPALLQSKPYFHSASVLVHRRGHAPVGVNDSTGMVIGARMNSVQHRALARRLAHGEIGGLHVFGAEASLADMGHAVRDGRLEAIVVDAHDVTAVVSTVPELTAGASLPTRFDYAWTVRTVDRQLGTAARAFLERTYRKSIYNILTARYFDTRQRARLGVGEPLSPYDDLVRTHAAEHDFDWRLIVAQIYQESRFDPFAQSPTGARGLMQLQPATARDLGVVDAHEPDAAIGAGVSYLSNLRARFDEEIGAGSRTWFALAAYNIGYRAVERARRRAASEGLDPGRWFGHVEQAMRLLAREKSRYRWGQAVAYVRSIRSLYNAYYRQYGTLTVGVEGRLATPSG